MQVSPPEKKKDVTARRVKDQHGLKSFNKAAAAMKKAGFRAPSNLFREALTHRKRLMEQLRRVDPQNAVLAELEVLDKKPAR